MTNLGIKFASISAVDDAYLKALHRGWLDKQKGRYWAGYETASYTQQLAYEAGRLFAVNVGLAGLSLPRWGGSRETSRPFDRAVNLANALVGPAVPPNR